MSKHKRGLKWDVACPASRHDNLIASQQFKDLLPFNVSYEVDKDVNMNFLIGWEYGRIWFNEFKRWEAMNYGTPGEAKEKELFRRRTVMRVAHRKKKNKP